MNISFVVSIFGTPPSINTLLLVNQMYERKIGAIWPQKSAFSTYNTNVAYYVDKPLIGCCYCFLFVCLTLFYFSLILFSLLVSLIVLSCFRPICSGQ